ncbi:uncharacterized protein RJT20DRAFT_128021 [Scheffersomyces xylosifermentans]|uniref:uncharacterized protein n=1 Tax=Scheffersomyces xylosifermentans TaxID=1304137 RepID=UPI00315C823A
MSYELIILPKEWFFSKENVAERFEGLTNLINKSYDKSRFKFGIIESRRIRAPTALLDDLLLTDAHDINFYILLGPKSTFDILKKKGESIRDFSSEPTNLSECYDCDIPDSQVPLFPLENISDNVTVSIASKDFVLETHFLDRVLATIGIRSYHHFTEKNPEKAEVKDLELTAFTSYMRKTGPKFLDLVIKRCLLEEKYFSLFSDRPLSHYSSIILHADCIKEHRLVEYYTKNCSFEPEDQEDIRIKVGQGGSGSLGTFDLGISATRDFHVSFIKREIAVR